MNKTLAKKHYTKITQNISSKTYWSSLKSYLSRKKVHYTSLAFHQNSFNEDWVINFFSQVKVTELLLKIISRLISSFTLLLRSYVCGVVAEAVVRRCFVKGLFLKLSLNLLEDTCAKGHMYQRLWHRCFPVNLAK